MKHEYTREELIQICEDAIAPQSAWSNRDSAQSHIGVGKAWALLKAGCKFHVIYKEGAGINTDENTIWISIAWRGFTWFEGTSDPTDDRDELLEEDTFYLPTRKRLEESQRIVRDDWY